MNSIQLLISIIYTKHQNNDDQTRRKGKIFVKSDSRFPLNETENVFLFPSLFLSTHQKKRNIERGKKGIFLCQKMKMKKERNDSITRQISLNKQFVLPSSNMYQKKYKEWSRDGKRLKRDGKGTQIDHVWLQDDA